MAVNVLLTGNLGFVGKHVTPRLEAKGYSIKGVDKLEPRVHGRANNGPENTALCNYWEVGYSTLRSADVIVHLAAQVGVADSQQDPIRYMRENTLGTTEFLVSLTQTIANGSRPRKLIVASSMSVYGDPITGAPVTEGHAVRPASVYGLSKYDQERLCLLWGKQHGIPVVALRFFNIYGPGQALTNPYTGVLANFANWLLAGQSPIVYEDGKQTRDFIYVTDVADAVVAAVGPVHEGVYNICTGYASTVNDMAAGLADALEVDIAPRITGIVRPGDIRHCIGDPTKFMKEACWYPKVSVLQGLKHYAEYLRAA